MQFVEITGVILLALNLAWTIVWSIHMKKQVKDSKNDKRVEDLHERTLKIETHMAHFPSKVASHEDVELVHTRVSNVAADLKELSKQVGEMATDVAATAATVKSINGNLDILNKSELLNQGKNNE